MSASVGWAEPTGPARSGRPEAKLREAHPVFLKRCVAWARRFALLPPYEPAFQPQWPDLNRLYQHRDDQEYDDRADNEHPVPFHDFLPR